MLRNGHCSWLSDWSLMLSGNLLRLTQSFYVKKISCTVKLLMKEAFCSKLYLSAKLVGIGIHPLERWIKFNILCGCPSASKNVICLAVVKKQKSRSNNSSVVVLRRLTCPIGIFPSFFESTSEVASCHSKYRYNLFEPADLNARSCDSTRTSLLLHSWLSR